MTFQSFNMLQLLAMLNSKALLLEKEAWGCLAASLAGTKTSGLWDILEDLFAECSESEEEEGPPSEKICQEDEPSTSSEPLKSTPSTAPSSNIVILMNEGPLHNSGISCCIIICFICFKNCSPLHWSISLHFVVYINCFFPLLVAHGI